MKSVVGLQLIGLVFLGLGLDSVFGYDAKCKGVDLVMTEQEMMHMKDCLKVINVDAFADINGDNVGCFSKCCMDKMGLVDADGKGHKENINNAIGNLWPDQELKKAMQDGVGKCLDVEGSQLKMDDDAKCSSFLPLSKCMHAAFTAVCA